MKTAHDIVISPILTEASRAALEEKKYNVQVAR